MICKKCNIDTQDFYSKDTICKPCRKKERDDVRLGIVLCKCNRCNKTNRNGRKFTYKTMCVECHKKYKKGRYKQNRSIILSKQKEDYRQSPYYRIWHGAKSRSIEKGLEFNLELSDIIIPDKCPVTGIKLKIGCRKSDILEFDSPSIDRIDSAKGYTKDNIIFVSNRVNIKKSNMTKEFLTRLYNFYCVENNFDF